MKNFDKILKKIKREFDMKGRSRYELADEEEAKKMFTDKLLFMYEPGDRKYFMLYVRKLIKEYGDIVDMDEIIEEINKIDEEHDYSIDAEFPDLVVSFKDFYKDHGISIN